MFSSINYPKRFNICKAMSSQLYKPSKTQWNTEFCRVWELMSLSFSNLWIYTMDFIYNIMSVTIYDEALLSRLSQSVRVGSNLLIYSFLSYLEGEEYPVFRLPWSIGCYPRAVSIFSLQLLLVVVPDRRLVWIRAPPLCILTHHILAIEVMCMCRTS
jgi:hypothetical protein